ncbi:MAG: twin-arginine translocase subunit TatC [Planctomycetota bacterium]|jgi:sec-independent protein translocase protein TatC
MTKAEKEEFPQMTLAEHLEELRRRIIYVLIGLAVGIGGGMIFGRSLLRLLELSYVEAMGEAGLDPRLNYRGLTLPLTMYLGVSLAAGLVIASPWVFYQIWMFVSAGLYKRERRYVLFAAPFTALLFLSGVAFFLFVASGPVIRFFIRVNQWMGYKPVIMLDEHVRFMTRLMIVFGIAFQTPLAVLLLAKMGIVSLRRLNKYRRHVIVGILILAAIFTPPDPLSQLALAIPMWLLYELGVLLAWLACRKKQPAADDLPQDDAARG